MLEDDIARRIQEGKCVLFLGAGVHAFAPDGSKWNYPADVAPPFGGNLSEKLAAESGYAKDYPTASVRELPRVAMHYELSPGKGRQALVNRIKEEVVDGKQPSPILRALGELNFPLVVTTNYDSFFEDSLPESKKPEFRVYEKDPNTESPTPDFGELTETTPGILKIHGDFDQPESLVITDEDYIHFVLRMRDQEYHPFPLTAQVRIQKYPTLFLGYSLLDYNMRLFLKTLRFRRDAATYPQGYSIDPSPDSMVQKIWQDQRMWVWFVKEGVWSFVPSLYKKLTGHEMV
jgi:hypothetical protein